MAIIKEPKPLIDITPKGLIREKQKYYLGVDNRMCKEYCHLIDSVAAEMRWNLDKVEWFHPDGRKFIGLVEHEAPKTLEQVKAKGQEIGYSILTYDERADFIFAVLKKDNLELNDTPTYRCVRYVHVNDCTGWKVQVDHRNTTCEIALTWLSDKVKDI